MAGRACHALYGPDITFVTRSSNIRPTLPERLLGQSILQEISHDLYGIGA
jgi:hypothetical protein